MKTLVLRISVPAGDGYQDIVKELAVRLAAYAGEPDTRSRRAADDIDKMSASVGSVNNSREGGGETVFEFRRTGNALVIHASRAGRSADARHTLPE